MTATDDAWAVRAESIARRWLARHAPGVRGADVDDVVQDALVMMLERPERWHVVYTVIDVLRARGRVARCAPLEEDVEDRVAQPHWFSEELVERAGLTENQLRACRLRLDGLTTREAADVLGITPRAFRMRLRRTRARIEWARQRS